jgi:disulfide bond formation protein DsbB
MRPSFLGLAIGGILIGVAIIMLFMKKQDTRRIVILLLLSIAISIHSILHFGEEVVYGFNPLQNGSFLAKDKPVLKMKYKKEEEENSDSDSDSD